MWKIFWLKNLHFSLEFFVALSAFSAAWLFLDSYSMRKQFSLPFKFSGFFLLAIATTLHATGLSSSTAAETIFLANFFGLFLLVIGFLGEPFQTKPEVKPVFAFTPLFWISTFSQIPQAALTNTFILIFLAVITFIHATRGYQKQLQPLVLGLAFLSLAESFETLHFLDDTSILWLSNLLTPFGGVFLAEHFFKFLGFFWIIKYVWQYLPYRLNAELFLAFVSTILAVTLVVTLAFTTLLLKSIEKEGLNHLSSDVKTLGLALKNLEEKTLSDAKVVAESSQISQALVKEEESVLETLTFEFMISMNADFLIITDLRGRTIINASNPEQKGQLITKDVSFEKALEGEGAATIVERESLVAPQILIQSSVPVKVEEEVVAVVLTGFLVDNAFVDGVKASTGLETTAFASDVRVATTLLSADGKSRRIGSKETNKGVLKSVLAKGETFIGPTFVLNRPFYSAYTPLKDASEKIIGMFSVGMPQVVILETAEAAIQRTYVFTALVIFFSLFPAFWLARTIAYQMS